MIASKILEEQATTEWLPINSIQIDMTYQRPLSPPKIKAIVAHFNVVAAGTLAVNVRADGSMFAMDGQHRLAAMKKLGIMLAECKVCRGLPIEQEAEIYIYCNTIRKAPDSLDVFRARLVTGDPVAIAITTIVEKFG